MGLVKLKGRYTSLEGWQNLASFPPLYTAIKSSKVLILMTDISHLPGLEILPKLYSWYKFFFTYFLFKQKRERENQMATIGNGCPQPIKRKIL